MGSKFIEKHKRKSVLAALLLLFQGRTKYVAVLLVVSLMSLTFVVSGETLGRIFELRPVAAFMRGVGLGSVLSVINPKYSNDLLKAALDKAAEDSAQNSFWNRFLKSVNATLPPAGSPSSMAMIRGGGDIFGLPQIKAGKGRGTGPGQIKGAVNDEERERGETGDEVNLESLLAGAAGGPGTAGGPGGSGVGGAGHGGGGGGLYGDMMGQGLAGRFDGGGASAGNAPYINRSMFGGGGSASVGGKGGSASGGGKSAYGSSSGMYNNAMGQAGSKVPVPGAPQKVNTKTMGRVSGFTWKNVGYKTQNTAMDVKIGNKKPMFQLAETFAMTASAYKSKGSAFEYQTAYTGATYDGNDVNLDAIQTATDASAPVVPDTSFTGDLIKGSQELQELAKTCSDSQGINGAKMSYDGKMMDEVAKTLGSPPKCCSGGVGAWNAKIDQLIYYCNDFNVNEAVLATKCQNKSNPMNCGSYGGMKITPCSKWSCFISLILAIIMIGVGLFFGIGLLVFAGIGLLVSQLVPGVLGMILSSLVGLAGMYFIGLTLAQNALSSAIQILAGGPPGGENK